MQGIDFNVDKIIPTPEMLKRMEAMMQMQAAAAAENGGNGKPKGAVAPKKSETANPAGDRTQGQDFRQVGNGERN
jgi:hypothetical protein